MRELIKIWQERQKRYEDLAHMWEGHEHNHRKFTYKAMATRDCWKELQKVLNEENPQEN